MRIIVCRAVLPPPMSDYSSSDNPPFRFFGELMEAIEGDDVSITMNVNREAV